MDVIHKDISLCTFLRISPRKINILKKNKLGPRELDNVDDTNVKKSTAQYNEYFKIDYKRSQKKWKKKKVLRIFYIEICYRAL